MSPRVPPTVALVLMFWLVFFTLFVRVWLHWRRTGSTGIKLHRLGTPAARATALMFASPGWAVAACLVDLAGNGRHLFLLDPTMRVVIGGGWGLAGLFLMWTAQDQMRDSWRAGVEETERTELVTSGLFTFVRNPIFSAWLLAAAGVFYLVPNVLGAIAFLSLLIGIEIQVRMVEEPYLLRTHGDAYGAYAARVGRLLPGLGRLRSAAA